MPPVPHQEESVLVRELKAGRPDAFSRLYDQYAPVLLGIISQIVRDDRKAAVLLAATFETVRVQIDQYRPESQPLFLWLLTIARRNANDALAEPEKTGVPLLQITPDRSKVVTVDWSSRPMPVFGPVSDSAETRHRQLLDDILFRNCTPEEAAGSAGLPSAGVRRQLREVLQQLRR